MKMKRLGWLLVVTSACLLGACSRGEQVSVKELAAHFADPPRESRPMVWWHWMNGNITKDGIRKDLEWMDRAGIRGFHHFDAALQTPQVVDNRLIYMTPEWKDAFRYALEVADSLDMEVGIASSPGWSHSGGPWVKPEEAMKKLVWREMPLPGDTRFEGALPEPFTVPCAFQNAQAIEYLEVGPSEAHLYEDIAVLALRLPEEDRPLVPSKIRVSGGSFSWPILSDGDLYTGDKLLEKGGTCWIEYVFDKPVTVRSLVVADQGGHGPVTFSADGTVVTQFTMSSTSQQTLSFEALTAKEFRLDYQLIPRSMLLQLLGLNPAEGGVGLTEFRLLEVSRVNRAEAKAAFTNLEKLYDEPTLADEIPYSSEVVDLSNHYRDGILSWDVPEGNWKVFRFGWSLTGKMNAPAPAEATGLEVDKLDPIAWERYFRQYLDMYKDAAGGSLDKIDYMLNDSWEAGCANWTPSLPAEFKARRGYDLLPWMPALTGHIVGSAEETEKFLLDWRETLEEILAENFDRLTDLLHSCGLKGRYSESHEGGRALTADGMDIKRRADIPMCAIWTPGAMMGSPIVTALADMRESASVSHIYGQKYVAAESMTAVGLYGQAYSYYPGNLKPVVDLEFASGVNRIIVHESAHQPLDDYCPGVSLSITGQWFNRHETWAEQAKPWTDYLARTSYLLSEGRNVADFLVYYGEDTNITARYAGGEIGLPKGYNYDFVNPYALLNVIEYKNGCFVAPSGNSWKVLVLDADFISDKIRQRLDAWKAAGARICTKDKLDYSGIAQDVETSSDIRFVHRSVQDGEIYWISKPSDTFETVTLSFRCCGLVPSVWDAETGEILSASYKIENGRTVVEIPITPNDAKFVVFSKQTKGKHPVILSVSEESFALDGPWHVSFQKGRGAPASAMFQELLSYTESDDSGIKYFSGTATYTKDFTLSERPEYLMLDLGNVQNIAEVIVNGHPVRTLWKIPYKVEITDYVTLGTNSLEVRVTNLWPNRLIRDAQLPEGERLTHITYPFYGPNDPLRPSGLIGPVTLVVLR